MQFQEGRRIEPGYVVILVAVLIGQGIGLALAYPYLGIGLGASLGGALGLDLLRRHKSWSISLSMTAMLIVVLLGGFALSDWYLGVLTGICVGSICTAILLGLYIWEQKLLKSRNQLAMALVGLGLLVVCAVKIGLFTLGY